MRDHHTRPLKLKVLQIRCEYSIYTYTHIRIRTHTYTQSSYIISVLAINTVVVKLDLVFLTIVPFINFG